MYHLSEAKQKELEICQAIWRRLDMHPSNQEFKKDAMENYGFYGGYGQWSDRQKAKAIKKGMTPLVVNIVQSFIDSLSGVEIQSRYRMAVRDYSYNIEREKLARALTHWLYFIQEDQSIPYNGSLKFRDMLICGLGWSNMYLENGYFNYENIHPFNILPDFDDLSPQFSNMRCIGRKRFVEPEVIKRLWPKVSRYIDLSDTTLFSMVTSPEIDDRNSNFSGYNNYSGYTQSRALICEVQRKVPKKAYCGIDYQGFYFETFDEEKAEDLANAPSDIEEKESHQVVRTLFLNDLLLETAPLDPNIPGLKDFSLNPVVWKRRFNTGVPYGLVEGMKDIQRDSNVRLTKALFSVDSTKVFITGNVPQGQTMKQLIEQVKRPDGVVVMPPNCTFEVKDNNPISDAQIKMFNEYGNQMQRVTGVYNDMLGQQTNATSGVAQRQRQVNSVRNNVFAFDNFANMKKREANFMLSMIQGSGIENVLIQVVSEEEKEIIILNLTRTVKGKKFVFNDVRTLPVSLQIEEVPDFSSSMEETKVALENLLSNPNGMFIMRSPTLMRMLGIRDYEKLAKEMQNSMPQDQQQQDLKGLPMPNQSAEQQQFDQNLAYPGL